MDIRYLALSSGWLRGRERDESGGGASQIARDAAGAARRALHFRAVMCPASKPDARNRLSI